MSRSTRNKNKNKFEQARELLHPSNLAAHLPCREKEYDDIFLFVKSSILEQVGGCMFISGVPGTGKTATVQRVFHDIPEDDEIKMMKNIRMFEINGLKMSDPNQFYSHFHFKIFGGKKVSKNKAIEELEHHFANPSPRDPFLVVLVDELDQLCTKKQTILYHLFDWPNRPNARLIILSVANTMNLPEQVMMSKIQSRLGLRRLTFQAYKFKELMQIVESRVGDLDVFAEDAGVQLICRKVASLSGDARRVLDLCRRAMDIAEQQNGKSDCKSDGKLKVTIKHVEVAVQEVFSSDKVYAIAESTEQEKTFLHALLNDFRSTNMEVAYFGDVYQHHIEWCRMHKIYVPTVSELIEIAYGLYAKRIILIEQNKVEVKSKISLNVSMEEINSHLPQ